jgi:hypothetical protein
MTTDLTIPAVPRNTNATPKKNMLNGVCIAVPRIGLKQLKFFISLPIVVQNDKKRTNIENKHHNLLYAYTCFDFMGQPFFFQGLFTGGSKSRKMKKYILFLLYLLNAYR